MVTEELEQLRALQEVDLALDGCSSREADARTRLKNSQDEVKQAKDQIAQGKKLLDDTLRKHKMLDLELQKHEEQIKKYGTQMYEVRTNKEYTALKEEIDKGKAESLKIEDQILQLMMTEDELNGAAGRRHTEFAEMSARLKQLEGEVDSQLAQLSVERETLAGQRTERSGTLAGSLLRRYEQIRNARGGSPLALVVEAPGGGDLVCGECHMTVRPQVIVEIYKQEELIACEACARILHLEIQPSSIGKNQS